MLRKLLSAFALLSSVGCCCFGERTSRKLDEEDYRQIGPRWRGAGGDQPSNIDRMTPERIHGGVM